MLSQNLTGPLKRALQKLAPSVFERLQYSPQADLVAINNKLDATMALVSQLASRLAPESADKTGHWRSIGDLRGFARVEYSQNGEDGILEEIFDRIKPTNKFFVEFGVQSGVQCNTRYIAERKAWQGVYLEANLEDVKKLHNMWQDNPLIKVVPAKVTSENFEDLLRAAEVPHEFDLLSIDIDSNDYWVWKSLVNWRPRCVVIEYNAFKKPPLKWVMKENESFAWGQNTYFGASFASLVALGHAKGYKIVGTDPKGVNMFFVRQDLWSTDHFPDPELHYFFQPFGYHAPPEGFGPFVSV